MLDGVGNQLPQHSDCNGFAEFLLCNDDKIQVVQKNLVAIARVHDQSDDHSDASKSGLHNADGVGDAEQIMDEKKFSDLVTSMEWFIKCRIMPFILEVAPLNIQVIVVPDQFLCFISLSI